MNPEQRKPTFWTFERWVTVSLLLLSIGGAATTLRSHETRITNVETRQDALKDTLSEMRGDVKLLLERTDPKRIPTR